MCMGYSNQVNLDIETRNIILIVQKNKRDLCKKYVISAIDLIQF